VLNHAKATKVKRFIQISSVAAMGFDYPDGGAEKLPLRPIGHPYVDTKTASEYVVLPAHCAGEILPV